MAMANTLEFPNGIRLAQLDELPGSDSQRAVEWARIQNARIVPGYTLTESKDPRFAKYAEINVNAPSIWNVFRDLCHVLLDPTASLIAGEVGDEPSLVGSSDTSSILNMLERHQYQLSHDGFVQFGLISDQGGTISEVFVAPTKHFKVWLNDERNFRAIMDRHKILEQSRLEFIDEYPRTTVALPEGPDALRPSDLLNYFENALGRSTVAKLN
jgi:hypothetical protein